ncbi:Flavonol synthase [Melia azedarach]|uniref:Flavonol synthase n=1 Tax=Melia azedarach TaxID=155640 RepID=A0ACC1XW66_MELAZ|nr:Flavonol synthase [Melia azedarach]
MEVERVQALASLSSSNNTIPAEFIRPEKEQPAITTYHGPIPEIPTIDLNDPDDEKVVISIAKASREWGIFQVVNHGIPDEIISKLQQVVLKVMARNSENSGPKIPPSYREVNEEYAQYTREVVDKLFKSLSIGLGLEKDVLKEGTGGENIEYMLKINYYPPCPRPDLALGVAPHTDLSALTILVPNQVAGLQVFKDDRWIDAKYIPNALIVHIGDQIEILSNGKYKAVLHRTTVDKERTRMSWPVFLEPPADFVVGPLPQLVNEDNPPKYKAKKFKDFAYCKLNKLPQ